MLAGEIMKKRRVVITGCGAVTPIGSDVEQYWKGLMEGKNGVDRISKFDVSDFNTKIAAEIKDFDANAYLGRKQQRRMGDFTQYAYAAAMQAVEQAQLEIEKEWAPRVGVIVGSGIGGANLVHENHRIFSEKGPKRVSPFLSSGMLVNAPAGEIAIALGAQGPAAAVVTACATASSSIGEAMRMIQYGTADVMIAGGTEGDLTPLDLASFSVIKALSQRNDEPHRASRPFDRDRDGFVIGSGSGILVLEAAEHAIRRGAVILAELAGYGATSDAYHITSPNPSGEGAIRAMQLALDDGGIADNEVDYINAHGTSTLYNDQMETTAIKTLFQEHCKHLSVSSTKSMIGHLMGAAGAVELIATVYAMKHGAIPPTLNCDHPDEGFDLHYVPNQAETRDIQVAISNSFGFGGHNVCLAVRRWDEGRQCDRNG